MNKDSNAEVVVKVSDFTLVPGARYRKDGDGSAEAFFEDILKSNLETAISEKKIICIDFDGTWGYASSFISELARRISLEFTRDDVQNFIEFKSDDESMLIDRLKNELAKDYDGQNQNK